MVTAVLTMLVGWCLFAGKLSPLPLAGLCIGLGALLAVLGRHSHTRFLTIDVLAQTSRLSQVHPSLKFWTVLALMVLCVSASSPVVGGFLTVAMLALTVWVGGLKLRDYVRLLTLPVTFLLLSGLALLFEVTDQPSGVLNIPLFGLWLSVSAGTQATALLVMSRALGAVSCLYVLSLSTPMPEIIGVLRRARCPGVVISLMYLIYRYLFVLLSMYHSMRDAAASRLGYERFRTSVRTTGGLYSNLLARSYRQASRNYDAMESRCFNQEIRFLENRRPLRAAHVAASLGTVAATLTISLLLR